jgi:hypothetical protein
MKYAAVEILDGTNPDFLAAQLRLNSLPPEVLVEMYLRYFPNENAEFVEYVNVLNEVQLALDGVRCAWDGLNNKIARIKLSHSTILVVASMVGPHEDLEAADHLNLFVMTGRAKAANFLCENGDLCIIGDARSLMKELGIK